MKRIVFRRSGKAIDDPAEEGITAGILLLGFKPDTGFNTSGQEQDDPLQANGATIAYIRFLRIQVGAGNYR